MQKIKINKKWFILGIISLVILIIVVLIIIYPLERKSEVSEQNTVSTTQSASQSEIPSDTTTTSIPSDVILPPDQDQLPAGLDTNAEGIVSGQEIILRENLPVMNEHFYIEYKGDKQNYYISLFAKSMDFNSEMDETSLTQAKKEALSWIAQFGVNIYDLNIEYNPPEAKDL